MEGATHLKSFPGYISYSIYDLELELRLLLLLLRGEYDLKS
jgi:hypothetical protein